MLDNFLVKTAAFIYITSTLFPNFFSKILNFFS